MTGGAGFSLFDLLSWYLVFLFSLVAHEASHAYAAWKMGDATAYDGGQVTLDPTPHIKREPLGTVVLPLATYLSQGWMIGWASAPYNVAWARAYPKREALMALAGPMANLAIAIGVLIVMKIGLAVGWFVPAVTAHMDRIVVATASDWTYVAAKILSIAYSLNVILLFFNLIPLPPLDGSSIIKILLPESLLTGYNNLVRTPAASLAGLAAAWFLFPTIGGPFIRWAMGLVV